MTDQSKELQPVTFIPKRRVTIDVLDDNMITINGTFVGGHRQFHEVLTAKLQHPFTSKPVRHRKAKATAPTKEKK